MPDRSGLDILRHIQTGHPSVRVLVMSGLPEQQYAVNVLRAGASGYLSKDSAPEELMKAVRTVLAGRRYVSAALAEILVADLDGDPDRPHACAPVDPRISNFLQAGGGTGRFGYRQ